MIRSDWASDRPAPIQVSSFWRGPKPESRIAVFVCGPESLVQAAEDAAVELNKNKDISVYFHAEAFAL